MWLYACLGIGICGLLLTNTGQTALKVGGIIYDTIKDRLVIRKKNIKIVNINDKNLLVHEDIILVTSKSPRNYDIICFYSDSDNLINKDVILNYDISLVDKNILPAVFIRHGSYISTVPFRPNDFNFKYLFVGIKNDSKSYHSVYKFSEYDYINLLDLIIKYEDDMKNNVKKIIFAEAFD
jgi:hypothetical protein